MAKVSLRAYNREIEAMIDRGHLDEAIAHCRHILQTYPKHLETYRLLGKAYLEAKKYDEAVDVFSRVLAAEPGDFVAHVGMSIICDEQGKLDDAIWHMERAFEAQSANPAIQGELQRLYGRRDGVQPPRIRMTRGALAHMYMRGELYPQAISETKNVLEEDPGRSDMQVLLANAYYQSGQKKDAADAASAVLKRYPFCLDANRILAEILGADRPESAQVYRRRVIELDPYAAQADTMFHAAAVSDAAVSIEQLDWNGQPVGMPAEWEASSQIALESGISETPEWMKTSFPDEAAPFVPAFASEPEASSTPAQPAEDIPDFLRAAGWGASTGAFEEGKASMFDEQPGEAEPIAQADLPDWVKAMAPVETTQPPSKQEEELPDWINKIGTEELPVPPADSLPGERPDWLGRLGQEEEPAASQPTDDQPDWLKGLEQEQQPAPVSESAEQPEWLKDLEQEGQVAPASDEQPDWMKSTEVELEPQVSQVTSAEVDTGSLGASEQEQDDSFAWLEALAAKQGATEGLLTKPEERLEEEPDWVKQAKSLSQSASRPVTEQPVRETVPPAPEVDTERLGTSEQEQDDSFAWLEALAAKQGATEGLLTKPEERLEEEPEWVKQAKELQEGTAEAVQEISSKPEPEMLEEVSPIADVSSWLKGLDEEEEAEGQPEPVVEEDTAAWLKSLDEPEEPIAFTPDADELPAWLQGVGEEEVSEAEPAVPMEEALPSEEMPVIEEPSAETAEPASMEVPVWLNELDREEQPPAVPAAGGLPAWMRDETGELVVEPTKIEPTRPADWMPVDEMEAEAPPQPAPSFASSAQDQPAPAPEPESTPKKKAAPRKKAPPAAPSETHKQPSTRKATETTMSTDQNLDSARTELSRSNIPGALDAYGKLIKKGRFLEEVIFDLREALYRYPVEVSIWQALGDAYMRANQLQDALDAYTKAEELLR